MSKNEEIRSSARPIGEVVKKIESMGPMEKKEFCRTLSLEERKQVVNYMRDRDCETVDVIFKCYEPMGGMVKCTMMPYKHIGGTYEFWDGQKYTLPICLAKRFNNEFQGVGTFYPTHSYIMDKEGKPIIGVSKRNHRFGAMSPSLA
jgi:hypothetical protein